MRSSGWWVVMALAAACGGGGGGAAGDDGGPGVDSSQTGYWAAFPNVSTGAIQETAVAALGTDVYVIGGFMGVTPQRQVMVFDTVQSSWREAALLPVEMHHANVAVVDDTLYVLGGMQLDGFSFVAIGDSYRYDAGLDEWTPVASMPAGTERGSAFVGVVAGKVYVAGGLVGGTAVDWVNSYDPVANEWSDALAPLPVARDHGVGAAVGGQLFAIGGREGSITAVVDRVDRYDPVLDEWTPGAPMITARGGTAAGVASGRIIVVGGEGNAAVSSGVFPQTESYDPVADEWTSLAPMLTPRHGMGAAVVGGALYVPGGATTQGFGATDVSEVYYP